MLSAPTGTFYVDNPHESADLSLTYFVSGDANTATNLPNLTECDEHTTVGFDSRALFGFDGKLPVLATTSDQVTRYMWAHH